jgi:hypothetical protein
VTEPVSNPTTPIPDIDAIYRGELRRVLHQFAREGRAQIGKLLRRGAYLGVAAAIFAVLLARWAPGTIAPFVPPVVVLLYLGIGYAVAHRGYRDRYKEQVVRRVVQALNPELSYSPHGSISRADFDTADFFREDIDRFRGEDLVEGRIGETTIRFSELHVEDKRQRGTGKNRRTEWVTVFMGLFVVVDFPKRFKGRTIVLPDTAQRFLGGIGQTLQSMNFTRGQLIKLEDPEFERLFVVYSDDQIEARYLLSTSLMQRILDLRSKLGHPLYLSFANDRLYLAIPSNRNRLEPIPLLQMLSYGRAPATEEAVLARIGEYVTDLTTVLGIVDELNLNRRIWS